MKVIDIYIMIMNLWPKFIEIDPHEFLPKVSDKLYFP